MAYPIYSTEELQIYRVIIQLLAATYSRDVSFVHLPDETVRGYECVLRVRSIFAVLRRGTDQSSFSHLSRAGLLPQRRHVLHNGLPRPPILRVSLHCLLTKHYIPTVLTFNELCDAADDELFNKIVSLPNHVLHALLPPPSTASQNYNLRHRTHSLQLPAHTTLLSDSTFITRMLYKDTY